MYLPVVRRWCRRGCGNDHDADDIAQNVFLKLADALWNYERRDDVPFRNWLQTVCTNAVKDYFRAQGRARLTKQAEDEILRKISEGATILENSVLNAERQELLQRLLAECVDKIDGEDRRVLELYLDGLRNVEIADLLSKESNAIDAAMFRTRKRLRDEISKYVARHPWLELTDVISDE
ncbi:MAG: sigma-70 family RNA polymerase sigma factor [Planctomycetaceae bacterium]|nr:sigma-70 family RNA polymerase sigma factor [Planctomycetaceae bacterium]